MILHDPVMHDGRSPPPTPNSRAEQAKDCMCTQPSICSHPPRTHVDRKPQATTSITAGCLDEGKPPPETDDQVI